jgi:hypothetical protein
MRIDGFLSLRRFELVDAVGPASAFDLLTLYQVADPADADFGSPAYLRHSASYTRPPAVVDGAVSFERTIYRRAEPWPEPTQPVGAAVLTASGGDAADAAPLRRMLTDAVGHPGVLAAYLLEPAQAGAGPALVIDAVDVATGAEALAQLVPDPGVRLALFRQVFPAAGVLLRDRVVDRPLP